MTLNPNDLRTYPVQVKPCKTCPFEGEDALELTPERYAYFIDNLVNRGQHLCHSVNNKAICRGGRNIQLRILCTFGHLSEPTDEAFNQAVNEAMEGANMSINYEKARKIAAKIFASFWYLRCRP